MKRFTISTSEPSFRKRARNVTTIYRPSYAENVCNFPVTVDLERRSVKHTVKIYSTNKSHNVRLITEGGDCPGNTLLQIFPLDNFSYAEQFAYILAKQIGATELEGVSNHVMGYWLLWKLEHRTCKTNPGMA